MTEKAHQLPAHVNDKQFPLTQSRQEPVMSRVCHLLRSASLVSAVGMMVACASDPTNPSAPTAFNELAASGGGSFRLTCERRSDRSKISVDGNNLRPRNGTFTARVRSGANSATSGARRAIGDEVEFDFDSNPNDVAAGATRISRGFIVGGRVTAQILRNGTVVRSGSASCRVR
jgi:hypothetical protein